MFKLEQWINIAFLSLSLLLIVEKSTAQTATSPSSLDAFWSTVSATGNPTERHENGFVAYEGKLYLIGGRSVKRVQIFDPQTNAWSDGAFPPFQMHHFQALVYNDLIYVIGAYTGTCCDMESGISHVWAYNPRSDSLEEKHEIPFDRRRGSTGAVVYNDKIYIVGGLEGGHGSGSTSFNWFDEYDPATGQWKILPNAPRKRDHFHAVVYNDKLYLTGGRDTSHESILGDTVTEIDVYDFATGSWSTLSTSLPTARGGTTSILYRGEILVIGGESASQSLAYNVTEALDPVNQSWRTLPTMNVGRHGTQATLLNDAVYIAAGAAQVGGEPELDSIEKYEDTSVELYSHDQSLKQGWNLIGLPLSPLDNTYTSVYNNVDLSDGVQPKTWNGTSNYQDVSQLEAGKGYWLKLDDGASGLNQTVTGTFINAVELSLNQGWNMIAGPSCDNRSILSTSTVPEGAIQEGLTYLYNIGGYKPAFSSSNPRGLIHQGIGYWVFSSETATLTLDCNSSKASPIESHTFIDNLSDFGAITIRDSYVGQQTLYFGNKLNRPEHIDMYQMPPRGPSGAFDARFTDNRRLTEASEAYVDIQASTYPLTIRFNRTPAHHEGKLIVEELTAGTALIRSHQLSLQQNLSVYDPSTRYLRIRITEEDLSDLPQRFALKGNYPNPFNPATLITFDAPEPGHLTVQLFDVLGREVLSKNYGEVQAGFDRSISLNALALPAGIYVYRLRMDAESGSFVRSDRMILMK